MKGMFLIVAFFAALQPTRHKDQQQDAIIGEWVAADGTRTVKIFKKGNTYTGETIRSSISGETGKVIIWNLVYDSSAKEWVNGKIKLGNMSHDIDAYARIDDKGNLRITGYHGLRVLGKSELYIRSK